ncbi:N-acetylneuraminic acid mutarotase [Deinococcus metalli]|uniref:N-acetylneuraminic acid mutarotase n=2 Tax=Deinococcus metalli TaxID=1141878 RepID=A0A7W8NNR9_9DEIO|nr:NPCBM/NEW2 domain-containing protein [Deinococcus metalli]MBB5374990.1 N-acetylneuraminic acid mutarotase [Deinococcus metalli]
MPPVSGSATLGAQTIDPGDNTLSNEPFASVSNGWGPVERNRSNGETGGTDGRTLTLNGVAYSQGFGTHAASSMTFDVQGRCQTFTADIGVDDEVGTWGSVVFQVYGDGVKLYESPRLTGADAARPISVPIAGRRVLRLDVSDAGDGRDYDHADWARAMLRSCAAATAPEVRLNAGGPALTVAGVTWAACTAASSCQNAVTGGFAYTPSPPPAIAGAAAPATPELYQSEWTGGATQGVPEGSSAFAFRVPVPNGSYRVALHFTELNKSAAGQRLFDVTLEGTTVLRNFDIYAEAGGANRALVRRFDSPVKDGAVDLNFIRRVENAKLSALEITPVSLPAPLTWSGLKPAPSTLYEAQGGAVGGRLYVLGGFYTNLNGRTPAATTGAWVYDPPGAVWSSLKAIPDAVTHAGTATDGPYLYVAGGFLGNHPGPTTNHVWRYDTRTDAWTALPPLPVAVGAGALVRVERTLHFFGGVLRDSNGSYVRDSADHWTLDLDRPAAWQPDTPLPNPRNHLGGIALGGLMYAVGGQHLGNEATDNVTDVHAYDPATRTWTAVRSLPIPLGHIAASTVAWRGRIVVVGGVTTSSAGAVEGKESATVYAYDPVTDAWSSLTALPDVRQSPVADIIGDALYVTTGATASGPTATTWIGR